MSEMTPTPSVHTGTMKKTWVSPKLAMFDLNDAQGSAAGPLCDKFGSLSHGGKCP